MHLTISPAYGRDYKSKKAALADFDANKDFIIQGFGPDAGRYVSKNQLSSGDSVNIRYKRMTMVAVVKIK